MRAGYWLQPNDMPWQEAVDECVRILSAKSKLEPKVVRSLLNCLSDYTIAPILGADDDTAYLVLGDMMRPIRRDWLAAAKIKLGKDIKNLDTRTFWYVDHDPVQATIIDLKRKAVGVIDTSSRMGWYGCGSHHYLIVKGYQTLYRLVLPFFWNHPERIYVHPLDVESIGYK